MMTVETTPRHTRDEYFEILRSEQPLALDDARTLLAGIEQACHEDPIEAAGDRWYFYGKLNDVAASRRDSSEGFDREAWEEIFQLTFGKLEVIKRRPLTDDLVDELLLNRMWRWKPLDALLLAHSLPVRFHHAGDRAKTHYVIREVARACRDEAKGAIREQWKIACRALGIEDEKDTPPSLQ